MKPHRNTRYNLRGKFNFWLPRRPPHEVMEWWVGPGHRANYYFKSCHTSFINWTPDVALRPEFAPNNFSSFFCIVQSVDMLRSKAVLLSSFLLPFFFPSSSSSFLTFSVPSPRARLPLSFVRAFASCRSNRYNRCAYNQDYRWYQRRSKLSFAHPITSTQIHLYFSPFTPLARIFKSTKFGFSQWLAKPLTPISLNKILIFLSDFYCISSSPLVETMTITFRLSILIPWVKFIKSVWIILFS